MGKIVQVNIENLKKGLYVVDKQAGQFLQPPIYSVEGFILDDKESQVLAAKGYRYAYIDMARSIIKPELDLQLKELDSSEIPHLQCVDFQEEFDKAQKLYETSLDIAKEIHRLVQNSKPGQTVDLNPVKDMLGNIVGSLTNNENAILTMTKLKMADEYTFTHSINVAVLAVVLGRKLQVQEEMLIDLSMAGFFHDIGKIFVPPEILNSSDKLNDDELSIISKHPEMGQAFLANYPQLPFITQLGALEHHERYDGSGYPNGKKGDQISLVGRILSVVDVYDALASKRSYKNVINPTTALSVMYQQKNIYSPGFVEFLIATLGIYPSGTKVKLSNNYHAIVIENNDQIPMHPKVVTLVDSFGSKVAHPRILDLAIHKNITILESVLKLPIEINIEEAIRYAK